jgi:hypothetical protein
VDAVGAHHEAGRTGPDDVEAAGQTVHAARNGSVEEPDEVNPGDADQARRLR